MLDVRRVVTGHDERGKSVFVSDERVPPVTVSLMPGSEFLTLWGADEPPVFPDAGSAPQHTTWFPPVGGYRVAVVTLPPAGTVPAEGTDLDAAVAEAREKLPGLLDTLEVDDPGMHTSHTVDFVLMLTGEVALELDDGAERVLRPGDIVVQNGTRHRWHNRGEVPVVFAVFLVGAHRR